MMTEAQMTDYIAKIEANTDYEVTTWNDFTITVLNAYKSDENFIIIEIRRRTAEEMIEYLRMI